MKCSYDNNEIKGELPFKCQHCNQYFCSEHRLPEKHNCSIGMKYYKEKKEKYFREVISDISKIQKKKAQKQKRKENYYKKKYEIKENPSIEINYNKLLIWSLIILFLGIIIKYFLF